MANKDEYINIITWDGEEKLTKRQNDSIILTLYTLINKRLVSL